MQSLLKTEEVAKILRVSVSTVRDRRWRERVGLVGIKIGRSIRYLEADVFLLLNQEVARNGNERISETAEGVGAKIPVRED